MTAPRPSAIAPQPLGAMARQVRPQPAAVPHAARPVRVTVIIKAYNEEARIARAVCSALLAVRGLGGEVVLADGGSTDRTVAVASRYPVRIVQLLDPRERSCGIGPELGWRYARGEYLYLMDGDMALQPGFLEAALALLAQHPEVAGVGGRVVERQLRGLEYRERQARADHAEAHRRAGPVDRLDGGGLYRRVAVQEVGYLSDRNLHSYEEFDLAVRLRVRGWRLWRLPVDAVAHDGHTTPAARLLLRRWRTRYAWGCGELLRAALGQPWLRLVLRDLRELRLYASVWLALALACALAWAIPSGAARGGALLAVGLVPLAVMGWRKRSGVRGLYALASWSVQALGLLAGLLAPRRPPRGPIAARVLREPALLAGAGALAPPGSGKQAAREIWVACPWTPAGGGMYKVADYLIRAQARGGAVRLCPLDTRGGGSALGSVRVLAQALWRLAAAQRSGRVAGVHVNMAERLSLVRKSLVVIGCRALGLPVVLHLHAAQLHRAWPRLPAPAQAGVRWVFSLPAACIVLGRQSARFVTEALRVPAPRVVVVTNGVPRPTPQSAAGVQPTLPSDGARLLFVGNLSARKGVDDLLQALVLPPLAGLRLTLTLAGGGDQAAWQARARQLGVEDRVQWTGWLDGPALAAVMAGAHALVLPSYDEGLPLCILEALALGLPVVCTPVGEIPEHLDPGRHACFVPPGDPAALAHGLARVLQDTGLRERLAREGQALWAREFSMERFFLRIASVHARCFGACATLPSGPGEPP